VTVRVKICGITNLDDALAAAKAGTDYLGFIFWPPSKRAVDTETAGAIALHLRQRERRPLLVGVFVDEEAAAMAAVLDECGLDLAQLSGDEPPALVGDPSSPLYGRSFKALQPASLSEAQAEAEWYAAPERAAGHPSLLLDAHHPTRPGGTGRTTDWEMAARLAAQLPGLMLAGGLTPENVGEAVRRVRPFAVDVASGVEQGPGKKDHQKVRAFIARAREQPERKS